MWVLVRHQIFLEVKRGIDMFDCVMHYLMGVGTPSDILGAVKRGIDMFD